MRRHLLPALRALAVFTLVCGLAYPLLMTGAAQALFAANANGSLVRDGSGRVVGSTLVGQNFGEARYFHPRPSAAGDGYDPTATAASNLGPTNPALADAVRTRVAAYRAENGLAAGAQVPIDAVTASASGLDPQISVANARLQVGRVATARGLDPARVRGLVAKHTDHRSLGVFGEPSVNVLELNLALDRLDA